MWSTSMILRKYDDILEVEFVEGLLFWSVQIVVGCPNKARVQIIVEQREYHFI